MKTIWKYTVKITSEQRIQMQSGARLLDVQVQSHGVVVWALVDSQAGKVDRLLRIYGTGHPADEVLDCEYVGTFQIDQGALVFHLFDAGEEGAGS